MKFGSFCVQLVCCHVALALSKFGRFLFDDWYLGRYLSRAVARKR